MRCTAQLALLSTLAGGAVVALAGRVGVRYDEPCNSTTGCFGAVPKDGIFGDDIRYYMKNTSDSVSTDADGVSMRQWGGRHNTTSNLITATPAVTQLVFPASKDGELPGMRRAVDTEYWLADDVFYIVVSGNVTIGGAAADKQVHGYGDVFWVMAGHAHGPITNTGTGAAVINVVSYAGKAYTKMDMPAPTDDNPSIDPEAGLLPYRSYRRIDNTWSRNPSPHSTQCMSNGGVWNMNWGAYKNLDPILRVRWSPNCSIPFHYHPTGAMYFVLYGEMMFRGDMDGLDLKFGKGDMRYVRPGFDYGPEYNDDTPMEITVLGTDTPPTFHAAPPGDYKVQKTVYTTHVYKHQPKPDL